MRIAQNDTLEQRLDDAVTSYLEAVEAGSDLDREKWLTRYPDLAEGLAAFFADTDRVRCWTEPLCQAVQDVQPGKTIPTCFGDYELHREIGRGGKGVVYEARQISLNRVVAIKMVRIDHLGEETEKQRLRNEAETVALLDHPQVVPVYDVGELHGQLYFSMKLLSSGSLAGQLDRYTAQPRLAAQVVAQVARAVHHAHQRGVLHRDLKPSNILLDALGQAHVADFGLARRIAGPGSQPEKSNLTHSVAILGTPSYMAPEQTRGDWRDVTTAADVYGLGGTLYALLTGSPPFVGEDVLATMLQVRERDPVPPRDRNPLVASDLETICLKCLEKEPARRYSSAEALANDLERWLIGKPIVARPVRAWERTWKWAQRKPAAAGFMVLSVTGVLAMVAGILMHSARLQKALDESKQNADEAQRQQKLARGHYDRARGTLEKMLEEFKSFRPGEVSQLRELQRRQIEDSLAFYQGALNDQDDADPDVRNDVAIASKRAGDLQGLLGKSGEARTNYTRAIQLLCDLPAEQRETAANQFLMASCYNHRGVVANQNRQWDDAERDHNTAREILESFWKKNSQEKQWRAALAETEHFLGALFQVQGKLAESESHLLKAAGLYSELAREHPEVESYLAKLADGEINLALLYQNTSKLPEAKRTYQKAEGHLLKLLSMQPTSGDYQMSLGALYSNWGLLQGGEGDRKTALLTLAKAIDLLEGVLKNEPNHFTARYRALNAHGARAQIYENLDQWADAVPDWERVVELDAQPNPWLHRVLRTVAIAQAGLHVRATTDVQLLAKDTSVPADGIYELGVACAISVKGVRSDRAIDDADRNLLAERYAVQAVAMFHSLHLQGYFQDPKHATTLSTDSRLQPLRGRADFEKLLR